MADPGRCDLCHRRLVLGETLCTYYTPSTATLEEAREHQDDPRFFWAEDPRWAACQSCHQQVQALDHGLLSLEAWAMDLGKKSLANQGITEANHMVFPNHIEHTAHVLRAFALHKNSEFAVEINEGVGR